MPAKHVEQSFAKHFFAFFALAHMLSAFCFIITLVGIALDRPFQHRTQAYSDGTQPFHVLRAFSHDRETEVLVASILKEAALGAMDRTFNIEDLKTNTKNTNNNFRDWVNVLEYMHEDLCGSANKNDGGRYLCKVHALPSDRAVRKTVSAGILQHPGWAILGYGFPLTMMMVGRGIFCLFTRSVWGLVTLVLFVVSSMMILGYAEFDKVGVHTGAVLVCVSTEFWWHVVVLLNIWEWREVRPWVYVAGVGAYAVLTALTAYYFVREENKGEPDVYAILEHIGIAWAMLLEVRVSIVLFAMIGRVQTILDKTKIPAYRELAAETTRGQAPVRLRLRRKTQYADEPSRLAHGESDTLLV